MRRIPDVRIERFAQLEPGEVFVYPHPQGSCLALKVLDEEAGGDQLLLPLGPTWPPNSGGGPRLLPVGGFTAVSYGKDYILRLPMPADAWSERPPADDLFCVALTDDDTYFRANFGGHGAFQACFIRASDGHLVYRLRGIVTYALKWEIVPKEVSKFEEVLVRHP